MRFSFETFYRRFFFFTLFSSIIWISGCAGPRAQQQDESGEPTRKSSSVLPWQSSGLKVGYIRSDVISDKYNEYKDAEASLKEQNRKWLSEVDNLDKDIRKRETELNDLALILSDERRTALEDELKEKKKELQSFRDKTWYNEKSEYVKRRRELMEPIDARVNDAIWEVCEGKGLDIVFDTVAGNIVYVKPGLDITEDVLEELKK